MASTAPEPGADAPDGDAPFPEDPRFRAMRRLVMALLVVMIAGVLAVVIALLLRLKDFKPVEIQPIRTGERIVGAEATAERLTLTLEDADGGQRVIVLDGANFQPLREIVPRPEAEGG